MSTNNLILIGFMGSGKTSVGIRLSYRLKITFQDTDKLIEKKQNCSVTEIFEREGEEFFRNLETECLQELLEETESKILSVGGGLPIREENQKLLKQLGKIIFLRVTPETVCERLLEDTTRPLLQGDDRQEKVAGLMKIRNQIYEQTADLIIDCDGKEFAEIMDEIQEGLDWYEDISDKRTQY